MRRGESVRTDGAPDEQVIRRKMARRTLDHWGFDGTIHRGQMVVNSTVTDDVRQIFGTLFEARFPIRRMRLVDEYGGDDDRSMAADHTSAFNCRSFTGQPG